MGETFSDKGVPESKPKGIPKEILEVFKKQYSILGEITDRISRGILNEISGTFIQGFRLANL